MRRGRRILAALAAVLWTAGAARAAGPSPDGQVSRVHADDAIARIASRAISGTGAIDFLRTLTDTVGPRVTGSAHAGKAAALILATLQQAGFASARFEAYPFQPRWERGPLDIRVSQPVDRMLMVGSYGWVPGTKGRIEAPLVDLGSPARDVPAGVAHLKGAAVLVDVHDIGAEPSEVMRAHVAQE